MEVLYKRCCGIDIHKNMMVACIFTSVRKKEIRQFSKSLDNCEEKTDKNTLEKLKKLIRSLA